MPTIEDLAKESAEQFQRAKLLGGTPEAAPPKVRPAALLTQPPPVDTAPLAQRSGALDNVLARPQGSAPVSTVVAGNPNVPPTIGSKEAEAYRKTMPAPRNVPLTPPAGAAPAAAVPPTATAVPPAAAPAAAPSPIAGEAAAEQTRFGKGLAAAKASAESMLPAMDGKLMKGVKLAGRFAEPVIEGYRVAQVAMDPKMTKQDVAQQAAEGATRWGATVAGSAIGAGLGAMTGPAAVVATPVGAIAGGVAGYLGGDELVSHVRSIFGLGDKSPAQRSSAGLAGPKPTQPTQPQGTVAPGPNGSTVATSADGKTAVLDTRPTAAAPAVSTAAAAPQGASGSNPAPSTPPTISGEAKAPVAPKKQLKSNPVPVAAATAPAPAGAPAPAEVDSQLAELTKQQAALGLTASGLYAGAGKDGVSRGWTGTFTDANGSFSNAEKMTPEREKAVAQYLDLMNKKTELENTKPREGMTVIHAATGKSEWIDGATGVAVPLTIAAQGKAAEYIAEKTKAEVRDADPLSKELAKQKLVNEGRIEEQKIQSAGTVQSAGVHAGATVAAAGISAKAHQYAADKAAERPKNNVVYQEELVPDEFGGTKKVRVPYTTDGDRVVAPTQPQFKEGQVYIDPQSKAKATFRNGKWEPVK